MSIPLDNLYNFIESCLSQDMIIYRTTKHGSQNVRDLHPMTSITRSDEFFKKKLICWDQEPLHQWVLDDLKKHLILQYYPKSPHALTLLLHSCYNTDLDCIGDGMCPAFYWTHAIIARDWLRFAEFDKTIGRTNYPSKSFLIYNRSWSGTREYRMKFIELVINSDLLNSCKTSFSHEDNGIYYGDHTFQDQRFKISRKDLHSIIQSNDSYSLESARYHSLDYRDCEWEVVLETVFDFSAVFLTEKILRPIAMGIPFICVGPPYSLQFLRRYGFQTFGTIIDESYDTCVDAIERMHKIIEVMKYARQLKSSDMCLANEIAQLNRQRFFSAGFLSDVIDELQQNLDLGTAKLAEDVNPLLKHFYLSSNNSIDSR